MPVGCQQFTNQGRCGDVSMVTGCMRARSWGTRELHHWCSHDLRDPRFHAASVALTVGPAHVRSTAAAGSGISALRHGVGCDARHHHLPYCCLSPRFRRSTCGSDKPRRGGGGSTK